jgi:CPA2 family monovalent cation:H+ antiporter-2
MHGLDLILTLTAGLVAALIGGFITQRLRLSPIVGYLIAGIVVGPYTPGFVADRALAEQLAEIGVILLMFGVGLQFHIEDLLAVRRVAVPGAIVQSLTATALGALLAHWAGWSLSSGIVFGIALSVASTVVLVRVLSDHRQLHTAAGHIAVGWLVVEDLFTVLVLVLMPAFFDRTASASVPAALGWAAAKVVALTVLTMVVGRRTIPWFLAHVSRTGSRELFTLAVLATALGIAVASAEIFGVSMALGAFLAGMVVGRSDYSLRAASEALPMRDAFAVLFFVSVGMLLDPMSLVDEPWLFAATLAIILVVSPAATFAFMWAVRQPFKASLTVAIALAQIGEFSFILSRLGREMGLFTAAASNTIIAASIASIVLNPLIYRTIDPIARWVMSRPGLARRLDPLPKGDAGAAGEVRRHESRAHRAVLIGYGPTGRTVARMLQENGITPTLIEINIETVRSMREQGLDAVYGDATRPETLAEAGMAGADNLILTSAGMTNSEEVIRAARELNPNIRVLARAQYLRDLPALKRAGANTVFTGEGEVALAFIEEMLGRLGATAEQIDRERARAHDELFGEGRRA